MVVLVFEAEIPTGFWSPSCFGNHCSLFLQKVFSGYNNKASLHPKPLKMFYKETYKANNKLNTCDDIKP